MIPSEVSIELIDGRLRIRPASRVPAEILAELRENRDVAVRLVEAAGEYPPVLVLNEFRGDLAAIAHCDVDQLRHCVQVAASWHGWRAQS